MTGRKTVLKTAISIFRSRGYEIDVVVFEEGIGDIDGVSRVISCDGLKLLSIPRILYNFVARGKTLTECMYLSKNNLKKVKSFVNGQRYDFVYCDMLRTVSFPETLNMKYHVDLDDLLSVRYETIKSGKGLLGYAAKRFPRALISALEGVLAVALSKESNRLRELEVKQLLKAQSVSLVSSVEARRLEAAIDESCTVHQVYTLPMAVATPVEEPKALERTFDFVFLGDISYRPNYDALVELNDSIMPALTKLMGVETRVSVVGNGAELAKHLSRCAFLGYVDNLHLCLCNYKVFVAPILSGTGIKTKVLDAFLAKNVVIGYASAFEGLDVIDGVHVLVATDQEDFAKLLFEVSTNFSAYAQIAEEAYAFVTENFCYENISRRWADVLNECWH
jgi:glycosyltransferase involved in cell wall biosynthesis